MFIAESDLQQDFRGAESVSREGEILFQRVTGCADLANQVPNTIDTKFASASAGKVFVAVGILQLIQQGRLRFEDTLGSLLELDLHDIDPLVTVEQLLTHTSGVPDYFDESVMDEYEELWTDYPNYKIGGSNFPSVSPSQKRIISGTVTKAPPAPVPLASTL